MNDHINSNRFKNWCLTNRFQLSDLFPTINKNSVSLIDLSTNSSFANDINVFNNLELFQQKINAFQKQHADTIIAGGYLEQRKLYTDSNYERIGKNGIEYRNIHLGIDYWLPEETPVHALLDGEVIVSTNNKGFKAYGGLIILKHHINGLIFFTLYGHLSLNSIISRQIGDVIKKGEYLGYLGNPKENGEWAPHLHFQIILDMLDYIDDFPGVAYPNEIEYWKDICPNPHLLFNFGT